MILVAILHLNSELFSENKSLVEAVLFNRRMDSCRILTRSQSFHDIEQFLVDNSALPTLQQLTCYLVCNSIQLRLSPSGNLGTSPTKRRSRQKHEENNLIAALTRLKQMKDLGLPTEICSQLL